MRRIQLTFSLLAFAFALPYALALSSDAHERRQPISTTAQLLIRHARVLDTRSGTVANGQTVIIMDGIIARVLTDSAANRLKVRARDTLDAKGRLLTPAFVDAHLHSFFIFGDSMTPTGGMITHLSTLPDSVRAYRHRLAGEYLPNGVTLVRDVGSATRDLPLLLSWMKRSPDAPDFLPSGAQFVSPDDKRVIPPFQVVLRDSAEAAQQVRTYAAMGIRNIKLYWRLQEPALVGALTEAKRLGITAAAHIDNGIVTINRALDLGVRHFEHAFPIALDVLREQDLREIAARTAVLMGGRTQTEAFAKPGAFFQYELEQWRAIGSNNAKARSMLERLRSSGSTVTPTLHIFAERIGRAEYVAPPSGSFEDTRQFNSTQLASAQAGFDSLAKFVARMDSAGVHLAVGTDTKLPGHGVLDEILLLRSAGISAWRVLRIATLYSAEAVGRGDEYGAVEVARRADLILFDADPLVNIRAILGAKTVIKDGKLLRPDGVKTGK